MSNMAYCRFSNTLEDLQDCYANFEAPELSEGEAMARMKLIKLCREIADKYEEVWR